MKRKFLILFISSLMVLPLAGCMGSPPNTTPTPTQTDAPPATSPGMEPAPSGAVGGRSNHSPLEDAGRSIENATRDIEYAARDAMR